MTFPPRCVAFEIKMIAVQFLFNYVKIIINLHCINYAMFRGHISVWVIECTYFVSFIAFWTSRQQPIHRPVVFLFLSTWFTRQEPFPLPLQLFTRSLLFYIMTVLTPDITTSTESCKENSTNNTRAATNVRRLKWSQTLIFFPSLIECEF